jgi:hypothetical protein
MLIILPLLKVATCDTHCENTSANDVGDNAANNIIDGIRQGYAIG